MSNDSAGRPSALVPDLTVRRLLDERRESLQLELLNPGVGLDRVVADPDVSSPGIALTGYTERFVRRKWPIWMD